MANTVYLMLDEKKDFALFKIGFTSNFTKRLYSYTTHNPLVRAIDTIATQKKSKRKVEKKFHEEIEKMGYNFLTATIDGKKTEWFIVQYNDPMYTNLKENGIKAFVNGRSRKNSGEIKINRAE